VTDLIAANNRLSQEVELLRRSLGLEHGSDHSSLQYQEEAQQFQTQQQQQFHTQQQQPQQQQPQPQQQVLLRIITIINFFII
jgi:hypothetical protein